MFTTISSRAVFLLEDVQIFRLVNRINPLLANAKQLFDCQIPLTLTNGMIAQIMVPTKDHLFAQYDQQINHFLHIKQMYLFYHCLQAYKVKSDCNLISCWQFPHIQLQPSQVHQRQCPIQHSHILLLH